MIDNMNILKNLKYTVLIFASVTTLAPFLWMFLTSFKNPTEIGQIPITILPFNWSLENFFKIFEYIPFDRYYFNSLYVSIIQTIGTLIIATMAAYAFSCIKFYGSNLIFFLYLGTIMIPGWVILIPVFKIIKDLGLLNTYTALIIVGLNNVMGVFLIRQFFLTIPKDYIEAAYIDGANHFSIYSKIIIPLSKPVILTVGLISFMGSWNSLLWPLILAQEKSMYTLPLGLTQLAHMGGWVQVEWGPLMGATLMSIIPILIIYIFLQNYFIKGVTLTGIK